MMKTILLDLEPGTLSETELAQVRVVAPDVEAMFGPDEERLISRRRREGEK